MILEHVGIRVSNLEKSIEFYTRVLGFKILRQSETNAYLFNNNDLLELIVATAERAQAGLSHLGVRVDDMDKTTERFKELGVEFTPPRKSFPKQEYVPQVTENKLKRASVLCLHPYWIGTRIRDPDGVDIEIHER